MPFNFKLKMKNTIKMMRPRHYIKNFLIFFPLFLVGQLFVWDKLFTVFIGFLTFCLMSSVVYIINDCCDLQNDRKHSTKRLRAIASGMITKLEAIIIAILLTSISFALNIIFANVLTIMVVLFYVVLNIAYSLRLKNIAILDLILLALCYVIRVLYGDILINAEIAIWVYLTVFSMAIFIGIIKRKNEILTQDNITRKVASVYSVKALNIAEYIFMLLTFVLYLCYIILTIKDAVFGYNSLLLLLGGICVLFILLRYVKVTNKIGNSGNPVEVLFKDITLITLVVLFMIFTTLGIYVEFPSF